MKTRTLLCLASVLFALLSVASAWLPYKQPIRGVNLGGLFIVEPWLQQDEWNSMGCGSQASEFDCVLQLGQSAANAAFLKHWDTWITQSDIQEIASVGLNTVRIPLGYWIKEDLVYSDSEHFPQGAFPYLERVCTWARDAGLYIILDLHGAPGAQHAQNAFTGQFAPTAGFYVSWQYERAIQWLEWITQIIHTNKAFATVGAIELVNEPLQIAASPDVQSMINSYYPNAWTRIRAVEDKLGITPNNRLHIQMMDAKWGSGNPNQGLNDLYFALYDDHDYVKRTPNVAANRDAYMQFSCHDDRGGNSPVIVGEWSLSTADEDGSQFSLGNSDAVSWYRNWWAAQVMSFEKQTGWIFWTWKVNWIGGRDDWRWGYQQAVQAGVIPTNPADAFTYNACNGF
ncbi:hypothetical protein O6H91_20G031000 [Diphasiastrum complanatum]|uniref:Uncharacterized protein n=2 Tax=Diphasiastrum complanatum TaxID=34168 RepID=A0ACC2ANY3_DIPCM|nr:hypothetical protein O6H91_20G031000 [Diphasiastrum complanatum]